MAGRDRWASPLNTHTIRARQSNGHPPGGRFFVQTSALDFWLARNKVLTPCTVRVANVARVPANAPAQNHAKASMLIAARPAVAPLPHRLQRPRILLLG
jgi:hypothetical protein